MVINLPRRTRSFPCIHTSVVRALRVMRAQSTSSPIRQVLRKLPTFVSPVWGTGQLFVWSICLRLIDLRYENDRRWAALNLQIYSSSHRSASSLSMYCIFMMRLNEINDSYFPRFSSVSKFVQSLDVNHEVINVPARYLAGGEPRQVCPMKRVEANCAVLRDDHLPVCVCHFTSHRCK
jgi:hypothetical protein